jgi:hypothetical protein
MAMLTFWGVITAVTFYGGVPAVGGLWAFERWRSRRRNRRGECAACGVDWEATESGEPFLIHGRLVCEPCAEKARRRMPWHFGILGAAGAIATGIAIRGADVTAMILFPLGCVVVMTVGAVQLMKLANRNAQRRIAAGEFPDLDARYSVASTSIGDMPAARRAGR